MSDITKQSLTELIENIKDKKLSSTDVTKAFIDRSEKSEELNAYITNDFTSALEKAKNEKYVDIEEIYSTKISKSLYVLDIVAVFSYCHILFDPGTSTYAILFSYLFVYF